jgi:DNA (cytosine-5)-methyltransferase 1
MNPDEITPSLDKSKTPAVAFMENVRAELRISEQTDALTRGGGKPGQGYAAALHGSVVRRLTPRECERLQGFPDDYTLIPYRGKPAADGPRYKALGNSMAVPVMCWIGERIAAVEAITSERMAA